MKRKHIFKSGHNKHTFGYKKKKDIDDILNRFKNENWVETTPIIQRIKNVLCDVMEIDVYMWLSVIILVMAVLISMGIIRV